MECRPTEIWPFKIGFQQGLLEAAARTPTAGLKIDSCSIDKGYSWDILRYREDIMIKTLVSLEDKQKKWLDCVAKKKGVPMAYLVREAVAEYIVQGSHPRPKKSDLKDIILRTSGGWKGEDGLKYQLKMRKEWIGEKGK